MEKPKIQDKMADVAKKSRILIVEDETPIARGLADVFVFNGFEVELASDGKSGLSRALEGAFDLVILDVMLPALDGFSVCHQLKSAKREQPVILLTAKTSEDDIVTGLSLGADDYVGKPFSIRELTLRVQAVLRRTGKRDTASVRILRVGSHLQIDLRNLNGVGPAEPPSFTRKEVEILLYLFAHRARPVTREELLKEVWGYAQAESIETRTVDIHIAKLRKKIEPDARTPVHLVTVRGEGYRLDGCAL